MIPISAAQIGRIKTMVKQQGISEEDEDIMVRGFTDMRTDSVAGMSLAEATALIRHLVKQDPDEPKAEKMRKKIIAMGYEMDGLGRSARKEEKQASVKRLDGWCKTYGYRKKGLNAYTYAELPKLVTQYEQVYKSTIKKL